jgi:hypothetical protein
MYSGYQVPLPGIKRLRVALGAGWRWVPGTFAVGGAGYRVPSPWVAMGAGWRWYRVPSPWVALGAGWRWVPGGAGCRVPGGAGYRVPSPWVALTTHPL